MHLANGAVSPECVAITWTGASAGLALAARAVSRRELDRAQLVEAAQLTGVVFAAQMINFPVLPHVSTHLIGGVLLAWRCGPALASLCMTAVLLTQALCLGDGGLAAIGCNILNMALIPSAVVTVCSQFGESRKNLFASAWLAVVLGALAVPVQVTTGSLEQSLSFAFRMLSTHALCGVVEGALTVAALTVLLQSDVSRQRVMFPLLLTTMGLLGLVPLSSTVPDGYEAAAASSHLAHLLSESSDQVALAGHVNLILSSAQEHSTRAISEQLPAAGAMAAVSTFASAVLFLLMASCLSYGKNLSGHPQTEF